mmetsp:Transcript_17700/g.41317  ORF Transcript_17700/g.41317 Transcript_17700/m.41317 type:complete len:763 (-) Transcript_17700:800-3088(-)
MTMTMTMTTTTKQSSPGSRVVLLLSSLLLSPLKARANRGFHPDMPAAWFMDPDWQNTTKCDIPMNDGDDVGRLPDFMEAAEENPQLCPENLEDVRAILDDLDALDALAVAYAPHLFFHPLENYTLSSVERTLADPSRGQILEYVGDEVDAEDDGMEVFEDSINVTTLMRTARDKNLKARADQFYIAHDLGEMADGQNYRAGDGFRVLNDNSAERQVVSNAPIYYNAHAVSTGLGENATVSLTFNYYTYYTWSGQSTVTARGSKNGQVAIATVVLADTGVREGDWQGMSVTVCNQVKPTTPIAVTYRARNHGQQFDCTQGECLLYQTNAEDNATLTTNPVAFVALSSHELYPSPADFVIYSDVRVGNWVSLNNMFLTDHTRYYIEAIGEDGQPVNDTEATVPLAKTGVRSFQPNASNVLRLPKQTDIPANVTEDEYWAAFRGHWGRRDLRLDELDINYTCLANDTLSYVSCPSLGDLPFFDLALELLGINDPTSGVVELAVQHISEAIAKYFGSAAGAVSTTGTKNTGPVTKSYYTSILIPSNAQIWDAIGNFSVTGKEFCYDLLTVDGYYEPSNVDTLNIEGAIFGIVWMTVALAFASMVYFVNARRGQLNPVIDKDEDGKLLPPSSTTKRWVYSKAWFFTGAYIWTLLAIVFFLYGYDRTVHTLENTFNVNIPPLADFFMAVLVIWVLMLDTTLFVILWLRTDDLWQLINQAYYTVVGDEEGLASFEHRLCIRHNHRRISKAYMVMYGCLMVTLVLSLLMW